MRTLVLIIALVVVYGCGLKASTEEPAKPIEELMEEEVVRGSVPEDWYGRAGLATLEEMVTASPIIVRGRLASVAPVGVRSVLSLTYGQPGPQQFDGYHGSLEFTFDVLEYLKGTGGDQVKGIAYGYMPYSSTYGYSPTPEEAAEDARHWLANERDSRWDDREAIVFLRHPPTFLAGHLASQLDHYWLGFISGNRDDNVKITVASGEGKAWLPDVASPGDTARQSNEQQFLLDDPGGNLDATTRTAQAVADSISLAALKTKIADIEAMVAAGGGSDAYRNCLVATYQFNRETFPHRLFETTIESGLPVDTVVFTYEDAADINLRRFGPTKPAVGAEDPWTEGRDAHLLGHKYPAVIFTHRPLPTGEYRVSAMLRSHEMVICDGDPYAMRDTLNHIFTVTAPVGTLAESFFDPATSSAAFVGTTTVGTISWEDNTVTADLTLEIPANAKLDFIALDGSVALSLAVADATETDGTLSWEVTPQPLTGGDQLMLRIHQPPPPMFADASYKFELSEDAEVGHTVGRVVAIAHDRGAVTFAVTAGNGSGYLALGADGDLITTTFMDHETASAYALTIEATGSNGGAASVTVAVTVTDVDPEYPPPPLALAVVEVPDGFDMTWKAVHGVEEYAAQWKVVGGIYTDVLTTTASAEVRPDGGVQCGTEYKFRVYSFGDGTSYEAEWTRAVPEPVFVTTTACP